MRSFFNTVSNYKYSVVFLLIIILTAFVRVWDSDNGRVAREKKITFRSVTSEDNLFSNLKKFEKYFNKTFPFRQNLLSFNNYIHIKSFGISPVDRVTVGKNGWLYLKKLNERSDNVDYSVTIDKFSDEELKKWFQIFNERNNWLEKEGIYLLVVIVPNKSSIYSEFLPDNIRKLNRSVRTDQFVKYFNENSDIDVLDLRKDLNNLKDKKILYHKTDSHWNHYGAWIGYNAIVEHLAKIFTGISSIPYEKFPKKIRKRNSNSDLASMLALQKSIYKEKGKRLFFPKGINISQKKINGFKYRKIKNSYSVCKEGKLPKIVMIHDSFGLRLKKYMSASSSEIIYLLDWGFNLFPEFIKQEKPEIVIYEIAERFLYRPFFLKSSINN